MIFRINLIFQKAAMMLAQAPLPLELKEIRRDVRRCAALLNTDPPNGLKPLKRVSAFLFIAKGRGISNAFLFWGEEVFCIFWDTIH